MTTVAARSQTSPVASLYRGQIVVWVVLLCTFTVIGALPLLLQGLNLTRISQSRHLPLVLMGMLVTSCAPTLAALFVIRLYPGGWGAPSIFRQLRVRRVPTIWYLIALMGPILLLLTAKALTAARLGMMPTQWMVLPSFSGPGGLPFLIFGSLVAEEPGWRGFAQPRLQLHYGALAASVIIGLLWSTWHLWYVILPGGLSNVSEIDAVATYIRLTSTAVIYAWMYNSTQGNLFVAMVAHFGHNLAASLVPNLGDGGQQHLIMALLYFICALVVVFATDARTPRSLRAHRSSSE